MERWRFTTDLKHDFTGTRLYTWTAPVELSCGDLVVLRVPPGDPLAAHHLDAALERPVPLSARDDLPVRREHRAVERDHERNDCDHVSQCITIMPLKPDGP